MTPYTSPSPISSPLSKAEFLSRTLPFLFLKLLSDLSNIIHQDPINLKITEGDMQKKLFQVIELISQLFDTVGFLR